MYSTYVYVYTYIYIYIHCNALGFLQLVPCNDVMGCRWLQDLYRKPLLCAAFLHQLTSYSKNPNISHNSPMIMIMNRWLWFKVTSPCLFFLEFSWASGTLKNFSHPHIIHNDNGYPKPFSFLNGFTYLVPCTVIM